jgi:hypothetical protein
MEVAVGVLIGFVVRVTVLLFRWKQYRKRARPQLRCGTPFMAEEQEMRELLRRARAKSNTPPASNVKD